MGIERFMETMLKPHLYQHYQGMPVRIAPDPAGWQKTQVGELSPADVLKNMGYTLAKPHTNNPTQRIEAVERFLTKYIDGKPAFRINKSCSLLIKGFKSGYRWKMNRKGELEDHSPEKNESSHLADALQYACLVADTTSGYSQRPVKREIKPAPFRWGCR
jgi:hypothetical protein